MATAYNMVQILPYSVHPPKYNPGEMYAIDFEYTIAGTIVTGDTYTTPANALPANGIRIVDTQLVISAQDTNATPTSTISVGDSGSATRFVNAANGGNATSNVQLHIWINQNQVLTSGVVSAGSGYLYGASNATAPQIIVTVGGTIATAATTGFVRLRVTFYCTGEN